MNMKLLAMIVGLSIASFSITAVACDCAKDKIKAEKAQEKKGGESSDGSTNSGEF